MTRSKLKGLEGPWGPAKVGYKRGRRRQQEENNKKGREGEVSICGRNYLERKTKGRFVNACSEPRRGFPESLSPFPKEAFFVQNAPSLFANGTCLWSKLSFRRPVHGIRFVCAVHSSNTGRKTFPMVMRVDHQTVVLIKWVLMYFSLSALFKEVPTE